MMTPQDIRDKTFEKAVFGGYDMGSVDDFLDKVAGDLAAAQKETMILKAKMKVLVDKIEEYRYNEDALNRALLSAQKLSVQIEAEARHKADVVVAEANTKAQSIVGGIAGARAAEEARLAKPAHPRQTSSAPCASCAIRSSSIWTPSPTTIPTLFPAPGLLSRSWRRQPRPRLPRRPAALTIPCAALKTPLPEYRPNPPRRLTSTG